MEIGNSKIRSTLRFRPVARDDFGVITFIRARMALNLRHGFGLLDDSAHHRCKPWARRCSDACIPSCGWRSKQRLPARIEQPLHAAGPTRAGDATSWPYPFPALRSAGVLPDSWATQYAVLIGSAIEIPLLLHILHRCAKEFNENHACLRAIESTDPLTG